MVFWEVIYWLLVCVPSVCIYFSFAYKSARHALLRVFTLTLAEYTFTRYFLDCLHTSNTVYVTVSFHLQMFYYEILAYWNYNFKPHELGRLLRKNTRNEMSPRRVHGKIFELRNIFPVFFQLIILFIISVPILLKYFTFTRFIQSGRVNNFQ